MPYDTIPISSWFSSSRKVKMILFSYHRGREGEGEKFFLLTFIQSDRVFWHAGETTGTEKWILNARRRPEVWDFNFTERHWFQIIENDRRQLSNNLEAFCYSSAASILYPLGNSKLFRIFYVSNFPQWLSEKLLFINFVTKALLRRTNAASWNFHIFESWMQMTREPHVIKF